MTESGKPFTDMVNYRTLASLFKRLEFTNVPDTEEIRAQVGKTKDPQLVQWTFARIDENKEQFREMLAYYMADISAD